MPKSNSLYTTDPLKIITCTEKAVKVQKGVGAQFWLPFSMIEDPDEETIRGSEREEVEFIIPFWLAEEKGLTE